MQAMVSHADAESRRQPIQENRDRKSTPIEKEKSGDRSDVQQRKDDCRRPIHRLLVKVLV